MCIKGTHIQLGKTSTYARVAELVDDTERKWAMRIPNIPSETETIGRRRWNEVVSLDATELLGVQVQILPLAIF